METQPTFTRHDLGPNGYILETRLPESVLLSNADFETLWSLHPEHYDTIMMHGKSVRLPRWQQAYGKAKAFLIFKFPNGSVFVLPFETNSFTHEVLRKASDIRGRISVTLRGFSSAE